jgi:broad specificity phosphatase PhoE
VIQREFGSVRGLQELGDGWWPKLSNEDGGKLRNSSRTLAALATGGREAEASVDHRVSQLLHKLLYELPQNSVAVVAHCMVLHRLESMLREQFSNECIALRSAMDGENGPTDEVEYLDNTEVRSIGIPCVKHQ